MERSRCAGVSSKKALGSVLALMGILMIVGIAVSNGVLLLENAKRFVPSAMANIEQTSSGSASIASEPRANASEKSHGRQQISGIFG
jgi:hypothetical protein